METYEEVIKRQIDTWFSVLPLAIAYTASITMINDFAKTKRLDYMAECRLRSHVENEKMGLFK